MMRIMRTRKLNARGAAKDATHERIVSVAARAIRRSGYDGTGVADIMEEAGLTHGAFYAHFPSREAPRVRIVVAFIDQPRGAAMKDGLGSIRTDIQRQSGGAVAAAGERSVGRGCARGWD